MMKIIYLFCLAAIVFGCNQNPSETTTSPADTSVTAEANDTLYLNDLLQFTDMKALEKEFGKENVILDTLWGPEGMFAIGTKLFKGTKNEVEIMWEDTISHAQMISVQLYAQHNQQTYEPLYDTDWKTRNGVTLGMSLEDLIKLNEKPIVFLGFDWDYGGGVVSFEKGKLENSHLSIGLSYDVDPSTINETDFTSIIGDTEINTDGRDFSKFQIKVVRLGVYR